ncbi:hypothetical protein M758_6G076300 [Ceratodon purpureus]|uniref:Uncharacterized protein n=1 Tax=Ceratodon purpureus TaxID=3225 RepID=A0A8T0HBS7_CERPU|nr:hypothetical protein KC19_6G081000 [Ceratodon purpureus]KAG0613094.1 hypothetical protein M758_6G076300 [Ceratodon purpureus]
MRRIPDVRRLSDSPRKRRCSEGRELPSETIAACGSVFEFRGFHVFEAGGRRPKSDTLITTNIIYEKTKISRRRCEKMVDSLMSVLCIVSQLCVKEAGLV